LASSVAAAAALDAKGSSDPDKNALSYDWVFYKEASSYGGSVKIENHSSSIATVSIPADAGGKSIHVILELHDNGSPTLCAYRRVIIELNRKNPSPAVTPSSR
jgi:hypothetical protein